MTTPDNPYGDPGQNPPPPPAYGQPPAYGAPQYGAPQAGQPAPYGQAPYGQAPYGAPPAGNFGGTLAEWPTRVGSYLIDAVVAFPGWILYIIGAVAQSGALVALGILVSLGIGIWNLLRQGKTGQTVGKQVMGTYLVRESDGQYIGGGLSIVRAIAHIVDSVPCIPVGLLWPLWDAKKQTFADKIMGTVVVKG
ncbi:MAG: hypothetical protein QOE24_2189 [Frankiales bacterium]|nr:hypothetical protein [Frankiales bacterium]